MSKRFPFAVETKWGTYFQGATFVINQATDKTAFTVQAQEDIVVADIGLLFTAITGTPVQHRYGIQNISAGLPIGTFRASATYTPVGGDANTFKWITLDSPLFLSRGEIVSLVFEPVGTPDVSNSVTVSLGVDTASFPSSFTSNGGAAFVREQLYPICGMRNADKSIVIGNPRSSGDTGVDVSVTGTREALKFKLPDSAGGYFKIRGLRFNGRISTATPNDSTLKIGVWDSAGNVLLSKETNLLGTATAGDWMNHLYFEESNQPFFFGEDYYIGLERTNVNFELGKLSFSEASDNKAFPGGTDFILSTWDGISWTDDPLKRPKIFIYLDDWSSDDPIEPESISSEETINPILVVQYTIVPEGIESEEEFGEHTFDTEGGSTHEISVGLQCISSTSYLTTNLFDAALSINEILEISNSFDSIKGLEIGLGNITEISNMFGDTMIISIACDNKCEIAVSNEKLVGLECGLLVVGDSSSHYVVNTSMAAAFELVGVVNNQYNIDASAYISFSCLSDLGDAVGGDIELIVDLHNVVDISSSILTDKAIELVLDITSDISKSINISSDLVVNLGSTSDLGTFLSNSVSLAAACFDMVEISVFNLDIVITEFGADLFGVSRTEIGVDITYLYILEFDVFITQSLDGEC